MNGRTALPELLAPAGSRKAFLGALNAGADAFYLGGEKFGARAYAENFTAEEIVRSIREAHVFGRKVYLTLNVLTKESELEETVNFAISLYKEGLDGVIVQDLGVLRLLHERCPGLSLHVSTQMSSSAPESVSFLRKLGVKRVVPARELSLEEIKAIKRETPVEIESFIHGAMCYSYSGRCLLSSFLGGRSGNRGRCAGTCRLPYRILDEDGKYLSISRDKEQYPLSMRDLCVLEILPDLIDAGIDSFKIEGRMKSPHYAAGVTALYRKYIDHFREWDEAGRKKPWKIEAEDMRRLRSLYLRADLSTGYYYRRNGNDLLTIGKPGYAGTDDRLLEEIEEKYLKETRRRPVTGKAVFVPGSEATLTVTALEQSGTDRSAEAVNGNLYSDNETPVTVQVHGEIVQPAQKRPMSEEEIEKRLRKTGDSLFEFENLDVEVSGDVFLPVASLNDLRRSALQALEDAILSRAAEVAAEEEKCSFETVGPAVRKAGRPDNEKDEREYPAVWAQVTTVQQLKAARLCGIKNIIVEETPQIMEILTEEEIGEALVTLPHVYRISDRKSVRDLLARGFRGVLVRNAEELTVLTESEYGGLVVGDGSLYQWNTAARDLLLDQCDLVNLGWEISAGDMRPLLKDAGGKQLLTVYGKLPMMISAGCVRKTAGTCSRREKEFFSLEDRKGMRFPVRCVCGHCYNVIYNSLPLSLHTFVKKADPVITGAAGWICSFTTESGQETEKILRWYMTGGNDADAGSVFGAYTTGHYRKSAL